MIPEGTKAIGIVYFESGTSRWKNLWTMKTAIPTIKI